MNSSQRSAEVALEAALLLFMWMIWTTLWQSSLLVLTHDNAELTRQRECFTYQDHLRKRPDNVWKGKTSLKKRKQKKNLEVEWMTILCVTLNTHHSDSFTDRRTSW